MQNYTVLKKLGTGTYGSAYLVNLKSNPLAQFVLKKVKIDGEGGISADGEVKVLRQLAHPLVLSYVDHFIYKGHLCIVTEYCDAGDLYQLLRARKTALPEPQLLDLFAQVLLAIQHVHGKNILHRDLKTQNIFLTSGGSIRLGDFGISRPLNGTMDLASTIIGTPYYMSPEVMSSMPYDFKSDMWSLGCVLYEMMSLKHAFDAADMSSLVMKILRGEHLPIPQGFSQELKDLVRQLLCKNPKMRPSAEQVIKMPFMKEYVARARETVSLLEGRAGGGGGGGPGRAGGGGSNGQRRTDHGVAPGPGPGMPQHRHSHSSGHGLDPGGAAAAGPAGGAAAAAGAGGAGSGSGQLDRELEAAKERLRRIQLEREALLKQAQAGSAAAGVPGGSSAPGNHRYPAQAPAQPGGGGGGAAVGGGGGGAAAGGGGAGALSSQHSEPNLIGAGARGGAGAGGAGAGGAGGGGGAGARQGGVGGASWRDKEEALARLKARSSRDIPASSHRGGLGGGDVDAQLERHREQRQLRGSRPQSPDEGRGGGGGLSGSPNGGSSMDPRARMKARKEEEARRREAELLNARKAYFEERKQAAARQQQLYQPSTGNNHANTNRGGKLAALVGAEDRRVRALCLIDPVDNTVYAPLRPGFPSALAALRNLPRERQLPLAVVGGGMGGDCAPREANFRRFFAASTSPSWEVALPDAGHFQFLDSMSALQRVVCPTGEVREDAVRDVAAAVMVAWAESMVRHRGADIFQLPVPYPEACSGSGGGGGGGGLDGTSSGTRSAALGGSGGGGSSSSSSYAASSSANSANTSSSSGSSSPQQLAQLAQLQRRQGLRGAASLAAVALSQSALDAWVAAEAEEATAEAGAGGGSSTADSAVGSGALGRASGGSSRGDAGGSGSSSDGSNSSIAYGNGSIGSSSSRHGSSSSSGLVVVQEALQDGLERLVKKLQYNTTLTLATRFKNFES